MSTRTRRSLAFLLVLVLLVPAAALAGCAPKKTSGGKASAEATDTPKPAEVPPPPQLRDPRGAVYSYLLYISYAYRVLRSDVASATFDEYEEVRVNSYVEKLRQDGKALDQQLNGFRIKGIETEGATATVSVREDWKYRYISTATGKYTSPSLNASYDTTYTVIRRSEKWMVAAVQATALGEVK